MICVCATYYVYIAARRWLTTYHYLQSCLVLQIKQCRIPWNVPQSSSFHHFEQSTANTNAIAFRAIKMECDVRIWVPGDKKKERKHVVYAIQHSWIWLFISIPSISEIRRDLCVSMGITHSTDDIRINKTKKIESKTYNDRYTCKSLNSLTFRFRNNPVICEREKSEMLK